MAQINYKFRFSPKSQRQNDKTLANLKIELWAGNSCIVATTGWQLRQSNNQNEAPWLAGPQYLMGKGTQNEKYISYIMFWPKRSDDGGADTKAQYDDLRAQANQAYSEWCAAGCPKPEYRNQQAPAQQGYQQPQQAPAGPQFGDVNQTLAPNIPQSQPAPTLPQGWTTGIDTGQTPPKRWYRDAAGEGYWEGDPRLPALMAPAPPPPLPPPPAPAAPAAPAVPAIPQGNNPYAAPGAPAAPTPFTQPGQGGWTPPPSGPALG